MSTDLKAKVATNVKISLVATVVTGIVQAGITVILARLLHAADYGRYALSLAVTLLTTGLVLQSFERSYVVDARQPYLRGQNLYVPASLAAIALVVCGGMQVFMWLTKVEMPVMLTFGQMAANIIMVASVATKVRLRRSYAFTRLAVAEVGSQVIGTGAVSILLAMKGFGPYSLMWGAISQALIFSIAMHFSSDNKPYFFDWREFLYSARKAFDIGRAIALEVVYIQLPVLIVSSRLGIIPLGLFNRGYNLVQLPIQLLSYSMNRVIFSGLADLVKDQERLARASKRLVEIAAVMISPVVGGIVGSHSAFTYVVLGQRWMAASDLMPMLALTTWMSLTGNLFCVLTESTANFRIKFWLQLVSTSALVVLLLAGSFFSLYGLVLGLAASNLLYLILYIGAGSHILGVKSGQIVTWFFPGVKAGLICLAYAWGVGRLLARVSPYLMLVLQVGGCGALTLAYYFAFEKDIFNYAKGLLLPKRAVAAGA